MSKEGVSHKLNTLMFEIDRLYTEIEKDKELLTKLIRRKVFQDEIDHLKKQLKQKRDLYSQHHAELIKRYDLLVDELKAKKRTKKTIEFLLKKSAEVYRGA